MIRDLPLARVLVALGIVMLVVPALVPVQPILFHETRAGTTANGTQLEANGVDVIAYENLSERGQELYVAALRNGGSYTVPKGSGASDFEYASAADEAEDARAQRLAGTVAIERPPDADLPPADEPVGAAEREQRRQQERQRTTNESASGNETSSKANQSTPSIEERRQQIARYDLMSTRTDSPPLTAGQNLVRLLASVVGVVAIGVGGYLSSRP
ncbi:hypothetical protein [Halorientalis salina]|uniref:hypothetical protein n=1 Tax=Halorientalis salina TaxID=2932266 RepID=UPI0010AB78F4|nr:hypothetical protein [Halorientalis salina]